jgi:hypothetical protein
MVQPDDALNVVQPETGAWLGRDILVLNSVEFREDLGKRLGLDALPFVRNEHLPGVLAHAAPPDDLPRPPPVLERVEEQIVVDGQQHLPVGEHPRRSATAVASHARQPRGVVRELGGQITKRRLDHVRLQIEPLAMQQLLAAVDAPQVQEVAGHVLDAVGAREDPAEHLGLLWRECAVGPLGQQVAEHDDRIQRVSDFVRDEVQQELVEVELLLHRGRRHRAHSFRSPVGALRPPCCAMRSRARAMRCSTNPGFG